MQKSHAMLNDIETFSLSHHTLFDITWHPESYHLLDQAIIVLIRVKSPHASFFAIFFFFVDSTKSLPSLERQSSVLSGAVEWTCNVRLSVQTYSILDFVSLYSLRPKTKLSTGNLLKGATDADGSLKPAAVMVGIKLDLEAKVHLAAQVRGDIVIGLYQEQVIEKVIPEFCISEDGAYIDEMDWGFLDVLIGKICCYF
ncbi:uncharacterized protein EAE97_007121 [Botrytis byssoidea]|uniref:Uncharacterized protein n=1 Tax=Botrytis byssoidea TaxID=139641 RepID=A0A9P5IQP3_9HELO|nr:uncharacterized protein EAE97_007121 [Botrytis byssoidea]KAF7940936.1 hypothetical protein EAE97_007121 [Botrytis byssoidea]